MADTDHHPDLRAESDPVPCSLLRRLGAIFYDSILLFAMLFFSVALLMIAVGNTAVEPGNPFMTAFVLLVSLVFFGWFWTHGGQTLGMQTWRIRVEAIDGGPVTLAQAIKRFLASLLSWGTAGLGFLWALVDREKRTLHDLISGTRVRFYPKPKNG